MAMNRTVDIRGTCICGTRLARTVTGFAVPGRDDYVVINRDTLNNPRSKCDRCGMEYDSGLWAEWVLIHEPYSCVAGSFTDPEGAMAAAMDTPHHIPAVGIYSDPAWIEWEGRWNPIWDETAPPATLERENT